jgi:hypothetical protein
MTAYRIVFRGDSACTREPMFENMTLERVPHGFVLAGEVVDQTHLHGLLVRIEELGFDLVSAEPDPDRRARPDSAS